MKKYLLKAFNLFTVVLLVFAIGLTVISLAPPKSVVAAWDGTIATSFQSGSGTSSSPYFITTPRQLGYFLSQLNEGVTYEGQYIALGTNLDMTGGTWEANGTFQGNLDGRGYTITADSAFINTIGANATVQSINYICNTQQECYVFCQYNNGTILNCVVKGDAATDKDSNWNTTIGLLCAKNMGTIQNCGGIGSVYAEGDDCDAEAGLVAWNEGTVEGCYSAVSADANAPGRYNDAHYDALVGYNPSGTVKRCIYNSDLYTYSSNTGLPMTTSQFKGTDALNWMLGYGMNWCNWVVDSSFDGYPHLAHVAKNEYGYVTGYQNQDMIIYNAASTSITLKNTGSGTLYYSLDAQATNPANFTKYTANSKITITGYKVITIAYKYSSTFYRITRQELMPLQGSGTQADPYLIGMVRQLPLLEKFPDAYFKLSNNLNFLDYDYSASGVAPGGWTPISTFNGVLDGNGCYIRGLQGRRGGFIDYNTGTIMNLRIENHKLYGDGYFGAVANRNSGTITRCYTKSAYTESALPGAVEPKGTMYVGGVVGSNSGTVSYCRNDGIVAFTSGSSSRNIYLGGIVGSGSVNNCINTGKVIAKPSGTYICNEMSAGGITGNGKANNCAFTSSVSISGTAYFRAYAGSIIGYPYNGYGIANSCITSGTVYNNMNTYSQVYVYPIAANNESCYLLNNIKLPSDCPDLDFDSTWWLSSEGILPQGVMDGDGHCWSVTSKTLPTCTASGSAYLRCDICAQTKSVTIGAVGHSYTGYTSDNNATCTADGTKTAACKHSCGSKNTVTDAGSMLPHTEVIDEAVAATCTQTGLTEGAHCSVCGTVLTAQQEIAALGHSWKDATCTEPKTCTTCSQTEGNALGHTLVDATCTTPQTCSVCSETFGEALGHKWIAATCTEPKKCSVCQVTEGEAAGHSWCDWIELVSPSCTETGMQARMCAVCDETEVGDIAPTGHSWSDWKYSKAPTCTEPGEQKRNCDCGETETRPADATGHNHVPAVTAPTCTEQGYTTHTCAGCGDSYTDTYVDATGHVWNDWFEVKAPTCTETGMQTRGCSTCGQVENQEIDATGHSYTSVVTDPTCTEQGYTTCTCDTCGDVTVGDYVDAKGHSWSDWTQTKAPTCTEAGEQTRACACGETENQVVEATGHDWSEWTQTKAPTCTEPGEQAHSCACGETQTQEVAAKGHKWSGWIQTKKPTCTTEGSQTRICACGAKDVQPVAKLPHSYVDGACEKCGAREIIGNFAHDGTSMTLRDEMSMNFHVAVNENVIDEAYVQILVGDNTPVQHKVSDAVKGENDCYIFETEVAAAQLSDTIRVNLIVSGGEEEICTYSVREYAAAVLADETLSSYHELVKQMLNYGAKAQVYFDYNAEDPADKDLTVNEPDVPADITDLQVSGAVDAIRYHGATLLFKSKTAVRFYFDIAGDAADYTFTVGQTAYKPVAKDGLWYIEIADINPQDLDKQLLLTVSDGASAVTVNYSPLHYIVRMYNGNGSESLKMLLRAMYGYHLAAKEFVA